MRMAMLVPQVKKEAKWPIFYKSWWGLWGVTVGHFLNLVWELAGMVYCRVVLVDGIPGWSGTSPTGMGVAVDSRRSFRLQASRAAPDISLWCCNGPSTRLSLCSCSSTASFGKVCSLCCRDLWAFWPLFLFCQRRHKPLPDLVRALFVALIEVISQNPK